MDGVILTFILHRLNIDSNTIQSIVQSTDKNSPEYKLRMSILRSKEIKQLYKDNAQYIDKSFKSNNR